jgi:hypothetical protein
LPLQVIECDNCQAANQTAPTLKNVVALPESMASNQDKPAIELEETTGHEENYSKHDNQVILKSAFDNLGLWATVKRFWKARCGNVSSQVDPRLTSSRPSFSAISCALRPEPMATRQSSMASPLPLSFF